MPRKKNPTKKVTGRICVKFSSPEAARAAMQAFFEFQTVVGGRVSFWFNGDKAEIYGDEK